MPRAREVRDTFQTLISQNNSVIGTLDATISRTSDMRSTAQRTLDMQLESIANRLMDPVNYAALDKLAGVSGAVNVGKAYDQAVAASAKAREDYASYSATHGDSIALNTSLQAKQKEVADAELQQSAIKAALSGIHPKLKASMDFMAKYTGKAGMVTQADVDYFSSKKGIAHMWAWATDGHYRNGRRILRDYADKGLSTVELWQQEKDYVHQGEGLHGRITRLKDERDSLQRKSDEARRLQSLIVSDSDIAFRMKKEICGQLRDKNTINRAAIILPEFVGEGVLESWVKVDAYQRMAARLEGQKKGLKTVNDSLNKPMSKLNKAVRHNVTKDIRIDLKDTIAKVQTAQVASRHLATEVGKANARIDLFSAKNPRIQLQAANAGLPMGNSPRGALYDTTDLFMMYMVFNIIATDSSSVIPAVDPAAVHMTLGIPDAAASAAGLDVGNLVPQLDASTLSGLEGLGGNINIDTANLDSLLSNIDVSVPDFGSLDISVPDVSISVPDISVPDISISTDWGGGGFDGGGIGGFD